MRFASERGEASYYTCHKMDNCVSASYVINEIIMVIYGKINSSYSFNYYETMPLSEGSYMDLREF